MQCETVIDMTEKYARTDWQKKVYKAYKKLNYNLNETALYLNCNKDIIRKVIKRIQDYYTKDVLKNTGKQYSRFVLPKKDITVCKMKKPVSFAEAYKLVKLDPLEKPINIYTLPCKKDEEEKDISIRGSSTLYDKDGKIIQKWIKRDTSKNHLKTLVKEYIAEYSHKIPKMDPKDCKCNYTKFEKALAVYPIADLHLGMLSWQLETGHKYNSKIADQIVRETVTKLIDRSPACEECLICNLGDFFHIDNQVHQTERGGNALDVDSRYAKLLHIGIKLIRYVIEYALQKHQHVTVINCIGNHDDLGSIFLNAALSNIYEDEKRLTIQNSPAQRQYFKYCNTLIGCTHGMIKVNELPLIMATEKKQEWGNTDHHYWYYGHRHHHELHEIGDCKVEGFSGICANDAYAASKGYLSGSQVEAIIIHPELGETERFTININHKVD